MEAVLAGDDAVHPFTIDVSDDLLDDLKRRLEHARWPVDYGNDDWRYGANGDVTRELASYWLESYDWRAREALMNALPQFRTTIRGIPIHFVHVRAAGEARRPLIMTHGWPSTFWDFHKVVGPLANPERHGGEASDAFDVIVPSLPGYGFSSPLTTTGINFVDTADIWVELMERLGYGRFAAQGGDWGSFVTGQLGHKHADRLIGVHLEGQVRLDAFSGGLADPADYTEAELHHLDAARAFLAEEAGYMYLQTTKPQTPAYGLNDSPIGLLSWIVEKWHRWSDCEGDLFGTFSKDELLDTVMLYWVTQTAGSAARFYYEAAHRPWQPSFTGYPVVRAETCAAQYRTELAHQPDGALRRYYNLKSRPIMPRGGHFPQMEVPELLVGSIREFFRGRSFQ